MLICTSKVPLDTPVDNLEIPHRVLKCLIYAEMRTIEDVLKKDLVSLLRIRNFGRLASAQLTEALAKMGYKIGELSNKQT